MSWKIKQTHSFDSVPRSENNLTPYDYPASPLSRFSISSVQVKIGSWKLWLAMKSNHPHGLKAFGVQPEVVEVDRDEAYLKHMTHPFASCLLKVLCQYCPWPIARHPEWNAKMYFENSKALQTPKTYFLLKEKAQSVSSKALLIFETTDVKKTEIRPVTSPVQSPWLGDTNAEKSAPAVVFLNISDSRTRSVSDWASVHGFAYICMVYFGSQHPDTTIAQATFLLNPWTFKIFKQLLLIIWCCVLHNLCISQ